MIEVSTLPLRYLPSPWEGVVHAVCRKWKGTPYKLNRCSLGRGVDCIHFGAAVLDDLFGTKHSKDLKSLPPDACVHNRKGVWTAVRSLLRAYPCTRVSDGTVEAGDLLIFGRDGSKTPAHLLVAGPRGVLWEATSPCVRPIGYGLTKNESLVAIYRVQNKHQWAIPG